MTAEPAVLVAVAWPYANGPLHLGHVAGSLLPPDVFARYHRLRGRRVLMVSGSDMHGTPITVAAEKAGEAPEAFAERHRRLHVEALDRLAIRFDLFTSTATPNHARVVHEVFRSLDRAGLIERRMMTAPFDPRARRFLPDRYVEGECPNCGFADARGDQCDSCGRTLDPQDLRNPRSKLSGAPPEYRETEHFFFVLSKVQADLERWVAAQKGDGAWRPTVRNFTEQWLAEGLKDRAITRDLTYGVPLPAEAGAFPDKRVYVWFEAVVGYLSATIEWADARGDPDAWKDWWLAERAPRQHYFLGKDNIPFHTIIWPGMLLGHNRSPAAWGPLALPWDVPANEFLQFAGAKFSKSRGNAFYVLDLLRAFDADAVRYYLTTNMPERGDSEWTWPDFVARVNDELLAALGNYVNRVLSMCRQQFGGRPPDPGASLAELLGDARLAALVADAEADVPLDDAARGESSIPWNLRRAAREIEACSFKEGLRRVMQIARIGNARLQEHQPWLHLKAGEEGRRRAAAALLWHLGVIRALAFATAPFLPLLSERIWAQLGEDGPSPRAASEASTGADAWPTRVVPIAPGRPLGDVAPLVRKLDLKAVLDEFQAEREEPKVTELPAPSPGAPAVHRETKAPTPAEVTPAAPAKPAVTYDDFAKLDLRVGVVASVADHPKADKLYVLKVDLGGETRQILAGLRGLVPASELLGARVIVIANLAPREIRGLASEGMLLAAEHDGVVTPLRPGRDVPPGSPIR